MKLHLGTMINKLNYLHWLNQLVEKSKGIIEYADYLFNLFSEFYQVYLLQQHNKYNKLDDEINLELPDSLLKNLSMLKRTMHNFKVEGLMGLLSDLIL